MLFLGEIYAFLDVNQIFLNYQISVIIVRDSLIKYRTIGQFSCHLNHFTVKLLVKENATNFICEYR